MVIFIFGCSLNKLSEQEGSKVESQETGNTEEIDTSIEDQPLYPDPAALPVQTTPPAALISFEGEEISTPEQWWVSRQPEILRLFSYYAYGYNPPRQEALFIRTAQYDHVFGELGEMEEFNFYYSSERSARVLLVRPAGVINAPLVLGLNKCGNSSIIEDSRVSLANLWFNPQCTTGESGRGTRASYWDIRQLLEAGFAVATVAYGDLAPDVNGELNWGVLGELDWDDIDEDAPWGGIGAWAFGLSEISRHLASSGLIDRNQIILFGHSRRGKAALWAATQNTEIAGVWAHQSGKLGASLTRSFEGEPLRSVTTVFSHWFTPRLSEFVGEETRMPFDQHLLLASLAPRPVLISDGDADTWADPAGAAQAVDLAKPVYEFLGADPSRIQQRIRSGGHSVTSEDWSLFLSFAGQQGWGLY